MQQRASTDHLKAFAEKCRRKKLRVTPQRTEIFKILLKLQTHPSAEGVYRVVKTRFPNISFDTVNRTLLTFAEIGLIDVVEGYGDPRRFDLNLEHHHHFYCMNCRKITDLFCEAFDQLAVPKDIKERFTVTNKRVVLRGFCDNCGSNRVGDNSKQS
jgi:Fur family peroxide stress response transcriptional regulator